MQLIETRDDEDATELVGTTAAASSTTTSKPAKKEEKKAVKKADKKKKGSYSKLIKVEKKLAKQIKVRFSRQLSKRVV